jgi:hypothetical protein
MEKLIIIILVIGFVQSCKSQVNENLNKKNKIEKFDINKFNKKKTVDAYIENKKDSVIKMVEDENGFQKVSRTLNYQYINTKGYFKETLMLRFEESKFYNVPIGITKFYDEKGNITKQINNDVYSFSITQLVDKMKKDFNIDLLDNSKKGVLISTENHSYIYLVVTLLNPENIKEGTREIKINAMTGELVSDKTLRYDD